MPSFMLRLKYSSFLGKFRQNHINDVIAYHQTEDNKRHGPGIGSQPSPSYQTLAIAHQDFSQIMGLPTHSDEPASSEAPAGGASNKVAKLPPAALELATKLYDLARNGKTAELDQYVSAGIPANMTNQKGDTLLMLAAYHGHADTVHMLLQKGANPNVLNDRGQSPLAGAVFKAHDDVVKVLFEEGKADIYHGQPNGVDSARLFKKENYLAMFGVQE